jgi:S-DNA-T family DNA segregation ATPase FtsK/SpoIIIE
VSVSQPKPGRLIVRGLRRDPLLELLAMDQAPPGVYGSSSVQSTRMLYLGRDEHGTHRYADLANVPGICVGGMPGSGKSTEITSWLTQLATSPFVQHVNLDGKGAGEFADFEPRAWLSEGDNLDGALDKLETVHALMTDRLACVRDVLGVKNAWHVGPSEEWPLIMTTIDECQAYLDATAVKGDKQLEPKVRRATFLVSSLVRRGRSVMFLTVPATQKPTTDSLPSSIRDNCPISLCFGVKTMDAAAATLGTSIRDYPSYSPVTLADPAYAGCATVTLKTGQDPFTRLRGPYVTEDQAAEVVAASAHLRRDPRASWPVVVPDDASALMKAGE